MTTTQSTWNRDFASLSDALAPYARTIDGFDYIDPTAPAALVSTYKALLSVGYAKGWI